ncbi:unnamed protein product [Cuscuta campestris]|uniref:ATP-dependent DNA helicase n=1 Tax=Cuscuta campestris TaxID=132261 RepID=A0A484N6P3_9ASTE|nr:unnamed protein product [Cuscuta campestris]
MVNHAPEQIMKVTLEGHNNWIASIGDGNAWDEQDGYVEERAILAPTFDVVDSITEYMTAMNPSSKSRTYLSSNRFMDFLAP